jgi:hypothetical protein
LTEALARSVALEGAATGRGLREAAGLAVVDCVQKHFEGLPPNRSFPGETSGFWKQASRSTNLVVGDDVAIVSVNKLGVRQRLLGGELHPTGDKKYLAIPARAEAYGKTPGDFDNLRFAILGRFGAVLIEAERTDLGLPGRGTKRKKPGTRVKNKGETGGAVMFWLKRSVTQEGNPNIIPSKETINRVVKTAADEWIAERMKR